MQTLRFWLDRTATIAAAALLAFYMVLVACNVFARYFLSGGIQWYMEGAQFLNVWAMFIAGIGITASNDHLRVAIVEEALGGRAKAASRILVSLATAVFYFLLTYATYLLATRARQTISTMAPLKMAYVYWLLPFVTGLSALSALVDLWVRLTRGAGGADREGNGG